MTKPVLLKRVVLRNYKSYANCSVTLGPLTFLVGPNGAGKSNFLDALRLVTESLNASLDHALRERGGINEVRRRSSGHPTHFGIRLDFALPDGSDGWYAFRVGAMKRGGFEVQAEECHIYGPGLDDDRFYTVEQRPSHRQSREGTAGCGSRSSLFGGSLWPDRVSPSIRRSFAHGLLQS